MYAKSIDFQKKPCSPPGLEPATSWMEVSCTTHWTICAVVFDRVLLKFSPLLCLQPAAEHNLITALTRSDKREAGGWWVYDVRQLMCCYEQSQVSYWHDGRTDRQIDGRIDRRTAFQLYIYRLPYCIIETCRWKRVPLGPDNKIIPFPMFDAATY